MKLWIVLLFVACVVMIASLAVAVLAIYRETPPLTGPRRVRMRNGVELLDLSNPPRYTRMALGLILLSWLFIVLSFASWIAEL